VITLDLLQRLCPKTKRGVLEQFVEPLQQVCEYYDLNTKERVAAFLAQTAHESGGFNFTKENLNYSAKGLMTTFKKYFPSEELAKQYERQGDRIANRVYANRMSNGPEESGDGSRFKGRGLIQLTGRANYTKFAEDLGITMKNVLLIWRHQMALYQVPVGSGITTVLTNIVIAVILLLLQSVLMAATII
jgi:putative chitinase